MEDFFGFIDYRQSLRNTNIHFKDDSKTNHIESYDAYDLFFKNSQKNTTKSLNNEDFLILLNGEISNKLELFSHLNIDQTEINIVNILEKLYQDNPNKFIEQIKGQFSLFIFDKIKNLIYLYKDMSGIYPLYYSLSPKSFIFGNKVSQFYQAPYFQSNISKEGLASYLQFGYILQPLSIFENCYKVESGQCIIFDLKNHSLKKETHQKLENYYKKSKFEIPEQELIIGAKTLLTESIHQSSADNKSAVSLSGGYDSSTIAALLQAQNKNPIDTFTIGFEDQSINEAPYAKEIAKHLGTNHHEHYFSSKDAIKIVPKLAKVYDEPFADYAATPTIMTAELLKEENVHQLIVGDGGDEVFATADDVAFFERIQILPYKFRKRLLAPLLKLHLSKVPHLNDWNNLPSKCQKLLRIFSAPNIPQMVKIRNLLFREDELKSLIQNYTTAPISSFDKIKFEGYQESVDEIIGSYFKTTMIDGELVKSKGATAYHNIELKTPYLNQELIEYMTRIPASIKVKNGIKKHILKEIVYEHIPKKLLERPKSGFDIPFSSWMKTELKDLLYEQINTKRLAEDQLFYPSSILLIRDKFYAGNESYKYKLWRIFLFQLWYDNYIKKTKNKG